MSHSHSLLTQIDDPLLGRKYVSLALKRDDLLNPDIPGNKWRKLQYNLEAAKKAGHTTLLTFGGAYSNHLRAVAAAGQIYGFKTVGIVRGEEHDPLNWSLQLAKNQGMKLHYIDRESYRHKHEPHFIAELHKQYGNVYLLPEGGSNNLAVKGCAEIVPEIAEDFDVICCPVGTGGTLAGIAASLKSHQVAIGFSALKGGDFLTDDVQKLQADADMPTQNWHIETRYHFGGYAKHPPELRQFIADFKAKYDIELEQTYVAKMLCGIFAMTQNDEFIPDTKIIAIVTGPATAI